MSKVFRKVKKWALKWYLKVLCKKAPLPPVELLSGDYVSDGYGQYGEAGKKAPLPPLCFNRHHTPGTKFVSGDAVYYYVDGGYGEAVVHKVLGKDFYQLVVEDDFLHPDLSKVNVKYLCQRWDEKMPPNPFAATERESGYTLKQAHNDFGEDLQFAGVKQAYLGPEMCGITLAQLGAIMELDGYHESMSMYDIVEKLIKPLTKGTGVGYALKINRKKPFRASIMVSHAWGENYAHFVKALRKESKGCYRGVAYWVCAMAIYQCEDVKDVTIARQLGPDVSCGPFATVLKQAQGMIAVLTPAANLYERMWCVFEVHVAVGLGVPVCLVAFSEIKGYGGHTQGLYDAAIQHGQERCNSKKARCGDPRKKMNDDERKIRELIEKSVGGYTVIDTAVEWVKAKYLINSDQTHLDDQSWIGPEHPLLIGDFVGAEIQVTSSVATAKAIARISNAQD